MMSVETANVSLEVAAGRGQRARSQGHGRSPVDRLEADQEAMLPYESAMAPPV